MPAGEAAPKALEAASQALSLDETLADAHCALGFVKGHYEYDWPAAQREFRNLRVFGLLYGVKNLADRIESLLQQFDLEKFRNVKCGVLSSGEQTRVSLAKAMLNSPQLLLLDEPTASLDPAVARDIRSKIKEFAARSTAGVLWTSHNMYEVEDVCHRVLFLSRGRILLEGAPKTLPRECGKATLEELFISVAREPLTLEVE